MNGNHTTNGHEHGSLAQATHTVQARERAQPKTLRDRFQQFAQKTSYVVGTPWAFMIAVAVIVGWALSGKLFHFSDTWQLVINTGTTIVTFLMVFLIQNTQNRDGKAIQLKLDELIRSKRGARNTMVDLENCTEEELEKIEKEFRRVREKASLPHAEHERDVVRPERT
jgi:low affinity Fe/Cu permease